MTGTNLSVGMRVSATEPSSRSVYSVWSVFSLWVSPLTTSTRPVLDVTTPEIAPAARARARCQCDKARAGGRSDRSEEHTSELQSLMRISYAVFCLKKTKYKQHTYYHNINNRDPSVHGTHTTK